jgi:hypothetical protein
VQYTADNAHWALSSSAQSTCSVEPGTVQDVGTIVGLHPGSPPSLFTASHCCSDLPSRHLLQLRILGAMRTPFAVKGGGHTTNPGFSSTLGVQIAMVRFNTITVDHVASTVAVGAGLLWDDVYRALDGTGLNVVGGRVPGIGVAGLTLGGGGYFSSQLSIFMVSHRWAKGYSWKTNQFGLTIDNIDSYELVLPNETIRVVTSQDEDLYFGLRVCVGVTLCLVFMLPSECGLRVASIILCASSHEMLQLLSMAHTHARA